MFGIRRGLLLIILLFLIGGGYHKLEWIGEQFAGEPSAPQEVVISDQRRMHILYGDRTGGGHKFGTGKPCKSEFPQSWSDDDIIAHVKATAANDNLPWKKEQNGYYTAEKNVGTVRMKVVLSRDRSEVITAYPTNSKRNPCNVRSRTPANDNIPFNE